VRVYVASVGSSFVGHSSIQFDPEPLGALIPVWARLTYRHHRPVPNAKSAHLFNADAPMPALRRPNRRGGHPLIFFINDGAEIRGAAIRKILDHIGVESTPPKINQALGPPLWDACDDVEPTECIDDGADDDLGQQGGR
jgi:hypothetical protein